MIIVYTVIPAVLGTMIIATGIYLFKRAGDATKISSVSSVDPGLRDPDYTISKKEMMTEFKLQDEEKGIYHSRNNSTDLSGFHTNTFSSI